MKLLGLATGKRTPDLRPFLRVVPCALLCGILSLASGVGLNGCFLGPHDCDADRYRCTARGREFCAEAEGTSSWSLDPCASNTPFCIQTEDNVNKPADVECVAEPQCSATQACAQFGLCRAGANGCVATAEGCAKACPDGYCGFDGSRCAPTPEGCARAHDCKALGLCTAGPTQCTATVVGCANSDYCKSGGYCAIGDTYCVPTPEGCADSALCQSAATCHLSSEGQCEVTAESCAKFAGCARFGACFAVGQRCQATAETCASSTECLEHGFCRLQNGDCYQ
jgi:hypothetical protein